MQSKLRSFNFPIETLNFDIVDTVSRACFVESRSSSISQPSSAAMVIFSFVTLITRLILFSIVDSSILGFLNCCQMYYYYCN